LANYLKIICKKENWKVVGPSPSLISKVGKKFRWQILIHGSEHSKIPFSDRSLLLKLVPKKVILSIDVNPVQL